MKSLKTIEEMAKFVAANNIEGEKVKCEENGLIFTCRSPEWALGFDCTGGDYFGKNAKDENGDILYLKIYVDEKTANMPRDKADIDWNDYDMTYNGKGATYNVAHTKLAASDQWTIAWKDTDGEPKKMIENRDELNIMTGTVKDFCIDYARAKQAMIKNPNSETVYREQTLKRQLIALLDYGVSFRDENSILHEIVDICE